MWLGGGGHKQARQALGACPPGDNQYDDHNDHHAHHDDDGPCVLLQRVIG